MEEPTFLKNLWPPLSVQKKISDLGTMLADRKRIARTLTKMVSMGRQNDISPKCMKRAF
jgi:hypothetical protein